MSLKKLQWQTNDNYKLIWSDRVTIFFPFVTNKFLLVLQNRIPLDLDLDCNDFNTG